MSAVFINRNNFPILSSLSNTLGERTIASADLKPGVAREIQTILKSLGYYNGDIDGMPGAKTTRAIARFKEDRWLGNPELVGVNTIDSLLEGKHGVSEQGIAIEKHPIILPSHTINTKTGKSMKLPDGSVVYANQCIVSEIPLTWGEFTKDCERIPLSNQVVQGAIKFAKAWGWVRDKWGSPLAMTSGYRPPAVNTAVGGAKYSRHMQGDAGDIYPVKGNLRDLFAVVKASPFTGIGDGCHRGFVHCDCRPGSRIIFGY